MPFTMKAQDSELEFSSLQTFSDELSGIDTNYYIEYLPLNKTNINYSDEAELAERLKLKLPLVKSILEHIKVYGRLRSKYELQQIDGLDVQTIKSIQQYVELEEHILDVVKNGIKLPYQSHQLVVQSERKVIKSKAYAIENGYLGSVFKGSFRYTSNLNEHISLGFSAHKDAGEPIEFGHVSFYIKLKNFKKFNEVIIGNYQLQFGQGLCIGNALPPIKSLATTSLISIKEGIYASLSNSASLSARGFAFTYRVSKKIQWTSSYSSKLAEAKIESSDGIANEIGKIQTVNTYRTSNEINQKASIKSIDVNNRLQLKHHAFHIGLSQSTHLKQVRLMPSISSALHLIGIDSRIQFNNTLFFSELCHQLHTKELAIVIGSIVRLDKHNDFGIHYRNFSSNFNGEYSNAISNNNCQNEQGLLINYNLKLQHNSNLQMYVDMYKNPLEKYRVNGSNIGHNFNIEYQYSKRNLHDVSIRYRQTNNFINQSNDDPILALINRENKSLRFQVNNQINKQFILKQRLEFSWYQSGQDSIKKGFLFYTEVQNNCLKKIKICSRATVFSVEDYNCRIYAFEKDLSSTFKMNAWQNKGYSYYLLFQYHVNKKFEIKTKFAGVRYFNVPSIGSGLDQINSNRQQEIKIELKYKI